MGVRLHSKSANKKNFDPERENIIFVYPRNGVSGYFPIHLWGNAL